MEPPQSMFSPMNTVHVHLVNLTLRSLWLGPEGQRKHLSSRFLAERRDIDQEQLAMTNYEQE